MKKYIHPYAFKQLEEQIEQGFPYQDALVNTALKWNIYSNDLREQYEQKARTRDLIEKYSIGFLMLVCFAMPVLFFYSTKV